MRKFKVVKVFVLNNISKTIPSILTLTTFLIILNILLGILFSTTGVLEKSITDNFSVHFMEILNNEDFTYSPQMSLDIEKIEQVDESFVDYAHPVQIESESGLYELVTIIGMPKSVLSALKLNTDEEKFLFLPDKLKDSFKLGEEVYFEETVYTGKLINGSLYDIVDFKYNVTGFFEELKWDVFPENIVIIDEETFLQIADVGGEAEMRSGRIIVYVSDVSEMKTVENKIKEIYPMADIRYTLKHTGSLPEFSKILIAVSSVILVVLLVFCIFNINGNVKQILNQRQRDIGLLSLFGVDSKTIFTIFVSEYFFSGLFAFILTGGITTLLFFILKEMFNLGQFLEFMWIYIVIDFVVSILIFVFISTLQVNLSLKKLNKSKIFKDILK